MSTTSVVSHPGSERTMELTAEEWAMLTNLFDAATWATNCGMNVRLDGIVDRVQRLASKVRERTGAVNR